MQMEKEALETTVNVLKSSLLRVTVLQNELEIITQEHDTQTAFFLHGKSP
jgi:hypothetical protein